MAYHKFIPRYFPVLIFSLAFLQYANTLSHDYAWDDKLVITANEYTKKGTEGLLEIFTSRVSVPYKSEYRPVPQAMYAIEYEMFDASPRAGHFFNVLWYSLTCLLVYFFVQFSFSRLDKLFPFFVALLFVVHPLHVEAVANIKSRDEILTLLFGLSSIMLLVRALEKMNWLLLIAGTVCFILAFLSKSNAVTFLPLIALVAWYRSENSRGSRKLVISTVVIAVCSVALVVLIRHLHNTVSDGTTIHLNSTVLNNIFLWSAHAEKIIPTALVIIGRYVLLFLYPHPLIHLYGYNQIPLNDWGDYAPWAVVTAILVLILIMLRSWREKRALLFGVLFFSITYSVYSNLFFFAPDTMADRYMFIPSIGLAIVLVERIFRLAALDFHKPLPNTLRAKVVVALFALLLSAYIARTFIGNKDWKNDATLIHSRIEYMDNNAAAQAIYGYTLDKESWETKSPELRQQKKLAAMKAFTRAIEIYPDFYGGWISIGRVFAQQLIYDKAELAFLKAQRIEPLNSDSYFYLGTLYLTQQDHNLATTYLEKAILLDPKLEEAYVVLGKAYLQADKIDNLGSMAMSARRWFPDNVELEALLATYYFRRQSYSQAFELARSVISKDPKNILALTILSSPSAQSF
ncbi:MAG: glycosyltransferase family 39 protein [Hassallia sp.]